MSDKQRALEKLHEEYRKKQKEKDKEFEEWIRIQRTGGGAET
tara:strand:+ start:527 stop:652 length:126 start_codon:yes stop_codon:yes gene_type:complete